MYVLGIDGGGTKTAVTLLNENGKLIGMSTSGPSSIDTVPSETTKKNIQTAIEEIINKQKLTDIKINSVFAGLGGIASIEDENEVSNLIKEIKYIDSKAKIVCKNDVVNAYAGGLATKCGIAIIIGTGSVAYGIDEFGKEHRAGGYTFKEGDAGSAYDLGFQALKVLARALDGRYEKTAFTDELQATLNIKTCVDAINIFEGYFNERTKTAQLAKLVTKYADLGDIHALKIVEKGTDELTLLIKAVDKKLNLTNKEIAIIGSLGNVDTIYKKRFIEKVKQYNSDFIIHKSRLEPVIGASLMALKNMGIIITNEIISNLETINL